MRLWVPAFAGTSGFPDSITAGHSLEALAKHAAGFRVRAIGAPRNDRIKFGNYFAGCGWRAICFFGGAASLSCAFFALMAARIFSDVAGSEVMRTPTAS